MLFQGYAKCSGTNEVKMKSELNLEAVAISIFPLKFTFIVLGLTFIFEDKRLDWFQVLGLLEF